MIETLETPRLRLRPLTTADAEFFRELMNEPPFLQFVGDRGITNTADASAYLEAKLIPSYEQFNFGFLVIVPKEAGIPVGICGLIKREVLEDVDIGFALLTRFSGNGFAYEAASAVLNHARAVLGLSRVVAITAPDNRRSISLLQKLGLTFERTIEVPGFDTGRFLFS